MMTRTKLQMVGVLAAMALIVTGCGGGGDATPSARSRYAGNAGDQPAASTSGTAATPAPSAPEAPGPSGEPATSPSAPQAVTPNGSSGSPSAPGSTPTTAGAAPRQSAGAVAAPNRPPQPGADRAATPAPAPGVPGSPSPGVPGPGDQTGVSNAEVLLGMHMPQSGPFGAVVGKAWEGAQAEFRAVNDAGGINGRRIRLIVDDDQYSAQGAESAVRDLIENKKVFAVSCPFGVDQCTVGVNYANSRGVPYLHGGMAEAFLATKPWAFPVTASYPYGAVRLFDYLFTKRGYTPARKIAAFYLNSQNLDEMVAQADQKLAAYHAKFAVKYPAEKDQSDFSAAITKMQRAGVDTVWFHTAPDLIAKFAAQAKVLAFKPQYVFTTTIGGDIFATAAAGNLDGAFGLAGFADPEWSGTAQFRSDFQKYYPNEDIDEFKLLSYVNGRVFVEGLRRAGAALGRDSFARGMGEIDSLDTGISSLIDYKHNRIGAADHKLAVWEIHGTRTDQTTGFDF